MGISIGIETTARPRMTFGLDPRRRRRLLMRSRGSLVRGLVGLAIASFGAILQGVALQEGSWLVFLGALFIPTGLGLCLVLGGRRVIVDLDAGTLRTGGGVLFFNWGQTWPVQQFSKVEVRRRTQIIQGEDTASEHTWFPIALTGTGEDLVITELSYWEDALPPAEALAHVLGLPLHDLVAGSRRTPDELDQPLAAREDVGHHQDAVRPSPERIEFHAEAPARLSLRVRRPGGMIILPLLAMAILAALFFTIPVVFFEAQWKLGLLPLALIAFAAIHNGLGRSATVEVRSGLLRVSDHGLVLTRSHEFPAHELEELVLLHPESGGYRNVMAMFFDGVLVARSDSDSVRFGWGLSEPGLKWLRHEIVRRLEDPSRSRPDRWRFPIPWWWSPVPAAAGLLAGAALAAIVGGPLGVGVDLPFSEHLFNVGGLAGLLVGLGVDVRRRPPGKPSRRPLVAAALIVLAGVLLINPVNPWVHMAPRFDELSLLGTGDWQARHFAGWVPIALLGSLLPISLLGLAVDAIFERFFMKSTSS